ncbi:MAG: hypothetical protein HYU67_06250 [Flavobacteriia bacterium]|nr:hypothetical protein [Flavobacteriia bacterium]
MYKNKILCFIVLIFLLSCNSKLLEKNKLKVKKTILSPKENELNRINKGTLITLSFDEVKGIDRSEYPLAEYVKLIDSSFFVFYKKTITNISDESGGIKTTNEFYKAIKKGESEIKIFSREKIRLKELDSYLDTLLLLKTYKFLIN